jgi:hypothetical protein
MNTPQQTAARSVKRTGSPTKNMSGLPYGTGSIQKRGRVYWMVYRDAKGKVRQENTGTGDRAEAQGILAQHALATLRARMEMLAAIIEAGNEAAAQAGGKAAQGGNQTGHGDQHRAGRRSVRDHVAERGDRAAAKGGRR